MNVKEIAQGTTGTLSYYFVTAAPLTLITIWIVMAFRAYLQFEFIHQHVSLSCRKQVPIRRQKDDFLDAARMALAAVQTNDREE